MAPRPRKTGSKDLPPNLYRKTDSRNGVTYYSYRDPASGKWYGLGSDKAQAVREAVAANHSIAEMRPALTERIAAAPARRLSEWIDEYRKLYAERDVSAQSKETVRMRLNRLSAELGHHDTAEIGTFEIAGYLKTLTDQGKAQMAKAMRSLLSDVMREAIAAGWRKDNPVEVTRAAKVKIKRERLTLELWKAIYAEAKQPWLKRAMELAVLTGQRRDDIAAMMFKDVHDDHLHVVQAKTGARLRISTKLRLESLGLELGEVVKACRDAVVSKHLVHHSRTVSRATPGMPIMLDTLSSAFSVARDRAIAKTGINLSESPPTFHEMRSLAARLHAAEGRDPQALLGHKSAAMTALYRDSRGAEWIDVA
ncbi:phage integrase Arm DNA-binding domain-containing protein [Stutzerimonas nitrititolerans]|uniref:phage integrase Arm DNA-binding domain-containing protein n=1 Tax=Stutzerimonas nitrititolerans TaxID=2482751 RepID=UPI0028AE0993|nr:phage integrase Arm DNA-binding domain-containing protein [Stutzerimonas nitrititolerans]